MVKRRNNDLTVEELKITGKGGMTLDEAFSEFINDCYLRNLRPQTIKYYNNEYNAFKSTLRALGVEVTVVGDINTETIKSVIRYMQGHDIKPVSINTRLTALRTMFGYWHKQQYINANPMQGVSMLKEHAKVLDVLTEEELNKLLQAPNLRTFTGYRDYCILSVFIECGLRVSELVGLSVDDINIRNNTLIVRHAKTFQRTLPIQSKLVDILKRYMQLRGEVDTDALFVTVDNTPLSRRQVQSRLTVYGKKIGKKVSPHLLRHSFARLCVINGMDAFSLMALLGHTDITITKRYVHLFGNDIATAHKNVSPLDTVMKQNKRR